MTILASDAIFRASLILNDSSPQFVHWTEPEMLAWLNDGAKAIVVIRPPAHTVTNVLMLAAGTRQQLPADGIQLQDVTRNIIGADNLPGRAIRVADRQLLDDIDPGWHASRARSTVLHFTFDEREPRAFFVYPPVIAGAKVEAVYSSNPSEAAALTDSIDLPAEYMEALVSYICFRAHSKDSEYSQQQIAGLHYQNFQTMLGQNTQGQLAVTPNGASQ